MFCQTLSFLLLPGEIRNKIYRYLVGPKFDHDEIISLSLFRTQPAMTRVNKQIREESLSIYYGENRFWVEVYLEDEDDGYLDIDDIDDLYFRDSIKRFAPAQAQSAGIQNSLRHIRDFEAKFHVATYKALESVAKFEKRPDGEFRSETDWWLLAGDRLGDDDTDWADRTSVDALVKQCMEALPFELSSPPGVQRRLIYCLWLLGVNPTSDSTTWVSLI